MKSDLMRGAVVDAQRMGTAADIKAQRNVSTTLRQWHLDFRLDFPPLSLVG